MTKKEILSKLRAQMKELDNKMSEAMQKGDGSEVNNVGYEINDLQNFIMGIEGSPEHEAVGRWRKLYG